MSLCVLAVFTKVTVSAVCLPSYGKLDIPIRFRAIHTADTKGADLSRETDAGIVAKGAPWNCMVFKCVVGLSFLFTKKEDTTY